MKTLTYCGLLFPEHGMGLHAVLWPTFGNEVHQSVTFKVRSFRNQEGNEAWDFGDGSPPVK